jgi:hypothetical protein
MLGKGRNFENEIRNAIVRIDPVRVRDADGNTDAARGDHRANRAERATNQPANRAERATNDPNLARRRNFRARTRHAMGD